MNDTASNRLVWSEEFATGVPEIDEQHMILVHTLNEAEQKLARNPGQENLELITQDLLSYALYHFETEEELMHRHGYNDVDAEAAEQHLAQHRAFSAKVVGLRDDLKAGQPLAANELLDFLNQWLANHILKTDKRLGAFIVAKQGGTPVQRE